MITIIYKNGDIEKRSIEDEKYVSERWDANTMSFSIIDTKDLGAWASAPNLIPKI